MSVASPGGNDPPGGEKSPPKEKETENSEKPNLFSATDLGPYEVYIESKNDSRPAGNLHPMKIGHMLASKNISGVKKVDKKGRNRVYIRFSSYTDANNFVLSSISKDENLNTFIPRHLTTCQGVIRGVDATFSNEEITKNIMSSREVLNIRRLNRRVIEENVASYVPTKSVVITFKGSILPKNVSLFFVTLDVKIYVLPVVRCTNCLRFGHNAKACKSSARCRDCGKPPHPEESCIIKCIHCEEQHNALFAECKELKRQQQIKQVMAFENITFFEAAKRFPRILQNASENNNIFQSPQLFPQLPSMQAENSTLNCPTPIRTSHRSFASVSQTPTTTKKRVHSPGYDRREHNSLLWFENGNASPVSNTSFSTVTACQSPNLSTNDMSTFIHSQLNQLKDLFKPLPNPEQTFITVHSILAQIINNAIRSNFNNDFTVEH